MLPRTIQIPRKLAKQSNENRLNVALLLLNHVQFLFWFFIRNASRYRNQNDIKWNEKKILQQQKQQQKNTTKREWSTSESNTE